MKIINVVLSSMKLPVLALDWTTGYYFYEKKVTRDGKSLFNADKDVSLQELGDGTRLKHNNYFDWTDSQVVLVITPNPLSKSCLAFDSRVGQASVWFKNGCPESGHLCTFL